MTSEFVLGYRPVSVSLERDDPASAANTPVLDNDFYR